MTERTRSYQWQDPRPVWQTIGTVSGLEFLQREIRGDAPPPPICIAMRYRLIAAEVGRVVYEGIPGEDHYNAIGSVQGGWISGLLDAALGSAVFSTMPAGANYTTLELKTNFVRPISEESGIVTCEATIIHPGRRMGTSEARVTDAAGKLYAHGSTTCMIFPGP